MTNIIEVSFPNNFGDQDQDDSPNTWSSMEHTIAAARSTSGLQFKPRLGVYKNSTGSNIYNPETMRAYSYDWYCYFKSYTLKNGTDIFVLNTYYYSPSTAKHVRDLRDLLRETNPHLIITEIEAPKGLDMLDYAKKYYLAEIEVLRMEIEKPRTHAAKNQERLLRVKECEVNIRLIEKMMESE